MTPYTWLAGTGFWSTSTKWSPSGVPTKTDAVLINATGSTYSVNINSAAFAYSLAEGSTSGTLNATVNDGSSLTIGVGGFSLSGGAFNVNSGGTLTVNGTFALSAAGKFTLNSGGTLAATTTTVASGATFNWNGGTISGGTIDIAALNLSANSASGYIDNGAQVKNAAGTGPGTINDTGYNSYLFFDNTQTFANATINLGSTAGYYSFLYENDLTGTGTVLTLASSVTINVTGSAQITGNGYADDGIVNQGTIHQTADYLYIGGNSFTNSGTINDSGVDDTLTIASTIFSNSGTIKVSGSGSALNITPGGSTWSNTGSIQISGGAAAYLGGDFTLASLGSVTDSGGAIYLSGTLENAGGVLDGSGGLGDIILDGGTVNGGTAKPSGLVFSTTAGTLDDVLYDGALDLSASGAAVHLANGTQVKNAAGTGPGTINDTGYNSYLYFDNTQTFANATINLGNTTGYYSFLYENDLTGTGTVLTLASSVTINVTGGAQITGDGSAGDGIVNQGTIHQTADDLYIGGNSFTNSGTINDSGVDDTLTIGSTSFSNSGTIEIVGSGDVLMVEATKFTNLVGGTLTGGIYSVGAGSAIELNNNTTISTDNADIILTGAGSVIQDYNTTTTKQNSLDLTLRTIGSSGQLHILGGRNLITAAAAIADNGLLELGGGSLVVSGTGSSFTIGATGKLMGFGTASATASFVDSGLIEASGGTLTLQEAVTGSGGYQIDSGANLVLDGATVSGTTATFNGPSGTLTLAAPGVFASTIGSLGFVDHIDLMGITATAAAVNGSNQLVVTNAGATVATLQLSGANGGFYFLTQAISGGTAIVALPVPPTVTEYLTQSALYDLIPGGFVISDTATNIAANIGSLLDAHIISITATVGTVTVPITTFVADQAALDKISGGFAISDTAADISASLDSLNDPQISSITISDNGTVGAAVAQLTSDSVAIGKLDNAGGGAFQLAVTDTAANIENGLATLEADASEIASITVSSGTVAVSAASFLSDQTLLDKISGGFTISDTASAISGDLNQLVDANLQSIVIADNAAVGVSIAQIASDAATLAKLVNANASAYQLAVADTAADISADLDGLQADIAHIATITASDSAAVTASVAQVTNDASALAKLADANATPYQLAISDTAADVQSGLSTLVADNAHIASILAGGGYVAVSTAVFGTSQSTLDKIIGGYEVSDSAPNILAALTALNADAHVAEIGIASGTGTLGSGGISAANLAETGSSTTLTIAENLTYAGSLTQVAGTLSVSTSDTLTLKGTSSLAGTVSGLGALALAGGSATIASGAKLSVAKLSLTGATTVAALNESLLYGGTFTDGAGVTLSVASGDTLTLTGATTLGGTLTGLGTLTIGGGATTVGNTAALSTARWTISGAATNTTIAGGLVSYGGVFVLGAGAMTTIAAKDTLKLTGTSNISGTIAGAGALDIGGGAATFLAGAQVTAAAWSLISAGATTIGANLSYGGAFSQAAAPTLGVIAGVTLTLTGSSTLDGLVKGSGTLALTGGNSTIAGGAILNIANWSVDATAVTVGKNLAYVGGLTADGGAILTLSGTNAALTLTAHSAFDGATVNGAGILFTAGPAGVGSTAVDGLTVGGSVAWTNARTITQNGGGLTLGDSSNGAAKLTNAKAGVYDITDDHGVAAGNASSSIANAGVFEKTAGTGDSVVATAIANTGLIEATSGELDLQGTISASGSLAVGGGAMLRLDGTVAATQTLSYASGAGTILLDDLYAAGVQLFHGAIHGWAANDLLDVGTTFGAGTVYAFVENKGHTGGVLNLSDNSATASVSFSGLSGVVGTANFAASVNAAGETVFAYHA